MDFPCNEVQKMAYDLSAVTEKMRYGRKKLPVT